MEKKEFQCLFKKEMKELGFQIRGNYSYKFQEADYLIGVWLDHHPYAQAYFIEYGVIFNPDEDRLPFTGWCDWDARFLFTADPDTDLACYPIENLSCNFERNVIIDWFEYETRTRTNFENQLAVNIEKRVLPLVDKEFVLDEYRKNWTLFRTVPYKTAYKIAQLAELDIEEIIRATQ